LGTGDREARADGQRSELIECITAGAPIRKLLFAKAVGHTRVPFAVRLTSPTQPTSRRRAAMPRADAGRRRGAIYSRKSFEKPIALARRQQSDLVSRVYRLDLHRYAIAEDALVQL
jgi:hypothetical protein